MLLVRGFPANTPAVAVPINKPNRNSSSTIVKSMATGRNSIGAPQRRRAATNMSALEARVSLVFALASQTSSVSQRVLMDLATETAKYVFPKRFESRNLEEALMSVPDLETVKFKVLSRNDQYEIREVEPYFIAETTMPGKTGFDLNGASQSFNVLAEYLFGKNTAKEKMEMTTPVITRKTQSDGEKMEMTTPVITKRGLLSCQTEKEGTKDNVKQLLNLGVSDRSFKAFPVEFFVERAEVEGETEVEAEESLSSKLPEMSTATRSKSIVSASDLMAAAKAKKVAKKDNKPPTPMSMASSSDLIVSKKKEEVKKRKLPDTEAMNEDELGIARKKLKDAIANFVDKVEDEDKWQMSFVMPSKYGSNLPFPKDSSVSIREVPGKFVAVVAFSGFVTDDEVKSRESSLRNALKNDNQFQIKGGASVEVAQYNPPFTLPFTRRNEISLEVERKQE